MTALLEFLLKYSQLVSAIGVVLLAVLALWVDARADKKIAAAVEPVETKLAELEKRVIEHEVRLDDVEGDVDNLPTKADLARVEGEVKGAHREAAAAAKGVERIEHMLMERGMERT